MLPAEPGSAVRWGGGGQDGGFFYSEAMPESGVIWSEELLDRYLEDPK